MVWKISLFMLWKLLKIALPKKVITNERINIKRRGHAGAYQPAEVKIWPIL